MPSVIDTLVVELEIDPQKLKRSQRESIDALRKFEDEAKKRAGNAENAVSGVERAFGTLQKRLLGVAALMLGGLGIEQMVQRITRLQVATANLGQTFGLQSQMLQRWGAAGERFGVPGSAVQQGLTGLQQQRFNLRNFGDPSGILNLSWGTRGTNNPLIAQAPNGEMLAPEQLAMNIAKWLQKAGPQGANALMRMGGLSQDFVTFLMQGPEKIKKVLEETKNLAPSDEDIGRFKELNKTFEEASQNAQRLAGIIAAMFAPLLSEGFNNAAKNLEAVINQVNRLREGDVRGFLGGAFGPSQDQQDVLNAGRSAVLERMIRRRQEDIGEIDASIGRARSGSPYANLLQSRRDKLAEEIQKLTEELKKLNGGGASIQKQNFLSPSGDNVQVWKASLGGGGGFAWGGGGSGGGGRASGGSYVPDDVGKGLSGSDFLKARRQRFAAEMEANPGLRDKLAGMIALEGEKDPIPVIESLMNRMDYSGKSLEHGLGIGNPRSFYGPIRRGQLPGAIAALRNNPARMKRLQAAIDAALAGSNTIRGATDQGLPTDPNGRWPGGRMMRGGNVFNDWGGGPGGHEGARQYREMIQRGIESESSAGIPLPRARPDIRSFLDPRTRFGAAGALGGGSSQAFTVGNVHIYPQKIDGDLASTLRPSLSRFARVASANNGPA